MDSAIELASWRRRDEGGTTHGAGTRATVYVIEPDSGVMRSISWIFQSAGFDVCEFRRGEDLFEVLTSEVVGCVLVNLNLPGMSGVAVLEELGRRGVTMPVILLTGYGEPVAAIEAFRAGALDVVDKPFDTALLERVRRALSAEVRRTQRRLAQAELRARLSNLTDREREIAELIARGDANKVIAYDLGISERTVECHRARVMQKLDVKTVVELVRIVLLAGESDDDLD